MKKLNTWGEMMENGGPSGWDSYSNYIGDKSFKDWIMCPVSRNRDSNPLEESNFETALEMLGGESDTVQIHSFNHWAVGWYELLLINPEDKESIRIAEEIKDKIEDYPILDEEDYSEREYNEISEYWESLSLSERIILLKKDRITCFAARHDFSKIMSDYDTSYLYDSLRGD